MADLNISIGQIGVNQYLLIVLRKTTDPLATYASHAFPPPVAATIDYAFTNIDPAVYYVDFRESPDGVALGTLFGTFKTDVTRNVSQLEVRYYTVDSGLGNAPNAGDVDLIDPYLDGKTYLVWREGLGRPMVPPTETNKEFDLYTGGGFTLLNGAAFSSGEIVAVQIENKVPAINTGGGNFSSVVNITANTTLSSTHYNKRLRCEAASSSTLVVTFDDINNVPDGTAFKFTSNRGTQNQTRLLPATGQTFRYYDTDYSELSFAKGESLVIEKRVISSSSVWEVYDAHPGILQVGEMVEGVWKDQPNTMPEDGRLLDGDEWPRKWWWLNNKLPASHYIVDSAVTGGGYTHPAGKEGLYVIHPTLKKFRMPNTQGLSKRGLKNFTTYNADTSRVYDYPGGVQNEQVGDHTHTGLNIRSGSHSSGSSALGGNVKFLVNNAGDNAAAQPDAVTGGVTTQPTEMRVKNVGVINLRRM